ncbi:Mitochondrial inner membrane protease subunit 1 [Theileria parva strain Muguga]|uniref:Mitochondrial membrane protease subunit 2, putative n=1 Tax=Theileria parva TaxID=5875 RepID=Q4N750_THEPA|nr:Mitochondrial inner membrane protease subunit 1 [Theileria parva strain Muguga]EAN34208.1 Mitochondrial inner membrane protease subunit 1 [Theileria parva strain Muguga]|eukprot:XP_766491.1 mitochondrial membrane protease subunit 2 [Theileria parva strain Muguga]
MFFGKFKRLKSFSKSLLYTIGTFHILTYYLVDATLTKGPSMSPEISDSGTLVLYMRPYLVSKFREGQELYRKNDVVISTSPLNPNKRICKRIVGVPYETIHNTKIPQGHFWLQGDNRENSLDSRHYGAISSGLFQGIVFLIASKNGIKLI